MRLEKGFRTNDSKNYELYELLPVFPSPPIKIKDLARELNMSSRKLRNVIQSLPANSTVYEDDGEIGRIK